MDSAEKSNKIVHLVCLIELSIKLCKPMNHLYRRNNLKWAVRQLKWGKASQQTCDFVCRTLQIAKTEEEKLIFGLGQD